MVRTTVRNQCSITSSTKDSRLRGLVTEGQYIGEQASPVDQLDAVEMQSVDGRFQAMPRVDADTTRRWVTPQDFDLPQMIDSFDKLRLLTDQILATFKMQ